MSTSFSARAWAHVADRYADVCRHPFVTGLADGTLPDSVFAHYLADDAHYLAGYARTLARVASRLPDVDDVGAWAGFAAGAVEAERSLHVGELARRDVDPDSHDPSTACRAYVGMLADHAAGSPVEVAVAAVLPCFRVYAEVGQHLAATAADLDSHPYAAWIRTYDDPAFAASVLRAEATADRLAVDSPHVDLMLAAYADATDREWHFCDASWRATI
ncbi:MAG: TenA family protein [Propionibacteriales bacterium]|nr:TenA family protein [Propionibacteriales bacterium]